MAQYTYDLKAASVTVSTSEFTFPGSKQKVDGVEFAADYNNSVLETKHGLLTVTGRDHEYDFTALTGGEFKFTDDTNASVASFNGSAAVSAIKVTVDNSDGATANKALKNIITGSGKDVVIANSVSGATFDLGAGNDSIAITGVSTATVTLGDGKDTISIADANGSKVEIKDYSYADDTVILTNADATSLKMDYAKSMFTVKATSTEASINTNMNNGVYELNLSNGTNATHFVRTDVSSVDYVAKDAIDFASTEDTTALNLTLADKTVNKVSVGATSGTVNIVAGKAGTAASSVTIGAADVELGLGISKKSGEVALTVAGAKGKLDENDTLYLVDGGKLDELKFNTGNLEYAAAGATATTAKVTNAYDTAAEGAFNYNINGNTGVLRYGNDDKVTYTKGVSYYANAVSVDAADYGEVVLNLNGYCDDAFATDIKTIDGVTSGWVVGRNNKKTTINLATEANKKTEVYGGVGGNDTINAGAADDESTNVIWYSNGDGKDSVAGFGKGNNSIYFHDATAAASVLNDVLTVDGTGKMTLTLTKGKDELTLDQTHGKTIDFKDAAGNNFKVAVGDGTNVDYATGVNIYKGATTLKVSGSDDLILYTGANDDQFGYFNGITKIDATEATGNLALSGTNVNGMEIHGGTGVNNMWGGGNKVQTMYGNEDAVNVFWFGKDDGRDTAKNAKAEDGVYLYDVEKIADVAVKASTNYFTVNVGSNALKVEVGTDDATTVLEKFTFADKAGVLYTYNTKTNKFQQK